MATGSEKYAGINRARKGKTKSGKRKVPTYSGVPF